MVDVTDPTDPQQAGTYFTGGHTWDVALGSHYAYLADFGLQVIDVSNPANPQRVGSYEAKSYSYSVAVSGNYAYVGGQEGLDVIDISEPARPQRVGGNPELGNIFSVVVNGDRLFVVSEKGLIILHLFTQLPGPPVSFAPAPTVQGNTFHISLQGLPGLGVIIERSVDLLQWQTWTNGILDAVPLQFEDATAGLNGRQFYRARSP